MKAVWCTQYGPPDVLQLKEVGKPAPRDNEVLVRVYATSVTAGDVRMRSFAVPRGEWLFARLYLGIRRPRRPVLGMELAGEVESVGQNVTRFRPGDRVFASTFAAGFGGYAEYKCLPADGVVAIKPANLTFEQAAAVPVGGPTALRFLRKGSVQRGQKVLIYGASGSVGTYAIQLARHFGAFVDGVCSGANVELVRSLGAGMVYDYTGEDFSARGVRYDLVFDAVGKAPEAACRRALAPHGTYVTVLGSVKETSADLVVLKELIEAGELQPVIDRCYPLERIVEAHRYVEGGHKRGNVAILVAGDRQEKR